MAAEEQASGRRRVIVAGFGPVGRAVTERLEQAGIEVRVIELNGATVDRQARLGRSAIEGDVADPEVLTEAGLADADALILTIPDEESSFRACGTARQLKPGVYIAVRVNHPSGAMLAAQAGADHVTIEELVTAEAMRQAVLDGICPPGRDDGDGGRASRGGD
jgi:CPA2 family monovalent cation:H+ antiporter-2